MSRSGFSLLELMVAVMITSLVVIAGFTLLSNASDGFKEETERKILEANLRNAEILIQRDLSRVGYHSFMYVTPAQASSDESPLGGMPSASTNGFQSFYMFGDTVENLGAYIGNEFGLIADLSDYVGGFQVDSDTAGVLTLDSQVTTLASVLNLDEGGVSSSCSANAAQNQLTGDAFFAHFNAAFEHALGVFAYSPTNKPSLVLLESYASGAAATVTIPLTGRPNAAIGFPSDTGYRGTSIYPVLGIIYRVNKDALDATKFVLERCYSTTLTDMRRTTVQGCQTLIDNLISFEVAPLSGANGTNSVGDLDAALHAQKLEADKQFDDVYAIGTPVDLTAIRGFSYRIVSAGHNAIKGAESATGSERYTAGGHPIAEIQGTAMITTPIEIMVGAGAGT